VQISAERNLQVVFGLFLAQATTMCPLWADATASFVGNVLSKAVFDDNGGFTVNGTPVKANSGTLQIFERVCLELKPYSPEPNKFGNAVIDAVFNVDSPERPHVPILAEQHARDAMGEPDYADLLNPNISPVGKQWKPSPAKAQPFSVNERDMVDEMNPFASPERDKKDDKLKKKILSELHSSSNAHAHNASQSSDGVPYTTLENAHVTLNLLRQSKDIIWLQLASDLEDALDEHK
jgi:hypothetical protein